MQYLARIQAGHGVPQTLEALFAVAVKENGSAEFGDDIATAFAAAPDNVLLAAWSCRLAQSVPERPPVNWALALPLSLITALVLWWLSGPRFVFRDASGHTEPSLQLLITPVIALMAMLFFTLARRQDARRAAALGFGLAAITAYATWLALTNEPYKDLATAHVPLLAWTAAAVCLMGVRASARNRFAFLAKSIEVVVVTGLYAMAAMAFSGITMLMFKTLGITPSESMARLLMVGGAGLMPIIAVASVYDPALPPEAQDFRRGISKMVTTLPRLLLVLTVVVLAVYLVLIPANFMQPFHERNALITYNVMLFAVFALLLGATPVNADDLSEAYQTWLRRGIVSVAALVLLVGVYALAAVMYRTTHDGLTINRLTVIGWNTINISVLGLLLYRQRTGGRARWIESLHATFSDASLAYFGWAACVVMATAWLF